jgi:hypothetical protein
MDFPQKVFYGVFELPLLRNAQKRHKNKIKKGTYLPHLVAICQIYVGFKKKSLAPVEEKKTMHFLGVGGCFVVRRSHFASTPFKYALAAPSRLFESTPDWPLATQWTPRTRPTQGF